MDRIGWDDLPEGARNAIQSQTGPVLKAHTASEGFNCEIAASLHTPTGKIFIKGCATTTHKPGHNTWRR